MPQPTKEEIMKEWDEKFYWNLEMEEGHKITAFLSSSLDAYVEKRIL